MYLEVMIEDIDSEEVDQEELASWAEQYHLTMPVLSDPGGSVMWEFAMPALGGYVGLPYTVVLDKGAVVSNPVYATDADLDNLLLE